jgi:hypothetical protein
MVFSSGGKLLDDREHDVARSDAPKSDEPTMNQFLGLRLSIIFSSASRIRSTKRVSTTRT